MLPLSAQEANPPPCSRLQMLQGRGRWDKGCGRGGGEAEAVWEWGLGMVGDGTGRGQWKQSVGVLAKRWPQGQAGFRLLYSGWHRVARLCLNLRRRRVVPWSAHPLCAGDGVAGAGGGDCLGALRVFPAQPLFPADSSPPCPPKCRYPVTLQSQPWLRSRVPACARWATLGLRGSSSTHWLRCSGLRQGSGTHWVDHSETKGRFWQVLGGVLWAGGKVLACTK